MSDKQKKAVKKKAVEGREAETKAAGKEPAKRKPVKKKKGFRAKLQEKYNEANARLKESKSGSSSKKK